MVKGVSKRVVVIDAPDEKLFEQAIFIVRNNVAGEGISAKKLVQEARRVAKDCTVDRSRRFQRTLSPQMAAVLGAAAVGLIWAAAVYLA